MAKILRIHLAGVGHPEARFHPLTLRFDRKGEPMPSVLNLRNGGGKTSLLSLVYLVLLPLRHDFLGKVNGSDRVIEDYFTVGKLGIVALELESQAGRFCLVLAWVRKDRDENPSLFSFRTDAKGILFDDIPVQGLSSSPAASLSDLQAWLVNKHEERPAAVDLYIAPNYRKWQAHLRTQRGVDPHLYRTHLKMNKAEGAVDEMFKFARPRDFVRQYLEFAIEPTLTDGEVLDPVTAILNEHRLSLAKRPHYERERDFIDQVLPRLRELDDFAIRQRQAILDRTRAFDDLQRLAGGVLYWEKHYKTKQTECAAALATKVAACEQVVTNRDNAKRYASGFDRLARDLAIGEAQFTFNLAEQDHADCREQTRLLEAAMIWRAVREAEAKLKALQEKQQMLEQELRPEREEVERRALRLHTAFARAISTAESSCGAIRLEESTLSKRLKKLRAEKETSVQKVARLGSELTAQQNQIARANRARERLVEEGSLQIREDATVALKRHDDEGVRFNAIAESRREAAKESRKDAAQHRAENSRLLAQATRNEAAADKANTEIENYENAREACAALPAVRQVLEDGDFDPFNTGLVNALRGLADTRSKELLALGIERAEDQRILKDYDPEVYPLFSAPTEVTRLVAYLRAQKVRGVFTAYEWLSENTAQEEARERMRRDPAAYAGIVVNTEADFETIKQLATTFRLARPVRVTLSSRLDASIIDEGITFLPDRAGLFNSHAAAVEIGQIRDEQAVLGEQVNEVSAAAQRATRAADQVEAFQKAYSSDWITECKTRRDEAVTTANETRRLADAEASLALAHDESAQQATNEATDYARREGEARRHHTSVAAYLADFGKHLDGWLKHQGELTKELGIETVACDQLSGLISQSEGDAATCSERKGTAEAHLLKLRFERSRAGVDGYLVSTREATPASAEGGDIIAEQSGFDVARAVYEQKAHDKGLASELEAAAIEFERHSAHYEASYAQADRERVKSLSEETDIPARTDVAREKEQRASTAVEIARIALETAQKSRPKPLGVNERLELDPSVTRPTTAAEARQLCEEKTALAVNLQMEIESARLGMEDIKTDIAAHKDAAREYTLLTQLTHPATVSDPEENTDLTGSPEGDASRVKSGKTRFLDCQKAEQDIAKAISNRTEQLDRLLRDDRWQSHEVQMMTKLLRFTREELAGKAGQTARDCEERRVGLEGKLQEIEAVRGSILEKLAGRAQEAVRSLKHAERMSILPEGAGAWSGHKFLRVRVQDTGDAAERKVLLDRLLDSWVQPQKRDIAIPSGAQLSFDCLMAIMNQREVDIEILKPETSDLSILNYQPITRLASFSGGQRVTAAILLYCVIVRVRSDQGGMLGDCGFLMLDNPFGKASHFPLVDLQLKMASVMGVQLIYLTGINDLEALAGFPLRIRLRNNARAGTAGEHLVQPETNVVEAVRLGEHPRK